MYNRGSHYYSDCCALVACKWLTKPFPQSIYSAPHSCCCAQMAAQARIWLTLGPYVCTWDAPVIHRRPKNSSARTFSSHGAQNSPSLTSVPQCGQGRRKTRPKKYHHSCPENELVMGMQAPAETMTGPSDGPGSAAPGQCFAGPEECPAEAAPAAAALAPIGRGWAGFGGLGDLCTGSGPQCKINRRWNALTAQRPCADDLRAKMECNSPPRPHGMSHLLDMQPVVLCEGQDHLGAELGVQQNHLRGRAAQGFRLQNGASLWEPSTIQQTPPV